MGNGERHSEYEKSRRVSETCEVIVDKAVSTKEIEE
jgi:hypothetical protein